MTAREFIGKLFSRPGYGAPSDMRRLTRPQLELLRRLIGEDRDAGAVQAGLNGSFAWLPRGEKYVVTEDPRGERHSIVRCANIAGGAGDDGLLF